MKLEPNTTPIQLATAILEAYPKVALDFVLLVTRSVSNQLAHGAEVNRTAKAASRRMPSNVAVVIAVVSAAFGVTEEELLSKTKTRRLVRPRHMLWTLLRTELGMSIGGIATLFGSTRATVRSAFSAIDVSTTTAKSPSWQELRQQVAAALRATGSAEAAE